MPRTTIMIQTDREPSREEVTDLLHGIYDTARRMGRLEGLHVLSMHALTPREDGGTTHSVAKVGEVVEHHG